MLKNSIRNIDLAFQHNYYVEVILAKMYLFLSKVAAFLGLVFAMVDSKYLLVDVEEVDLEEPKNHELGRQKIAALKQGIIQT